MCFYCFMMHHSQEVKTGIQIKRSYIFYNKSPSCSVFPRSHILNRLKPNDSDAIRLMKHIFGFPDGDKSFLTCIDCSHGSGIESQCLYHSLLRLLKSLIRNFRSCQCNKLLFKHCIQISKDHNQDIRRNSTLKKTDNDPTIDAQSSPAKMKNESANSHDKSCHMLAENSCLSKYFQEVKHSDVELIESYSKHHQVVSFIWAVCRSIVPVSLLGNSSCWRSLQKNISKIVKLHKFENLNLRQCIHGIKMSCYSYLSKVRSCQCFCNGNRKFGLNENIRTVSKSINDQVLLRNLFSRWMHWFFSDMVVSIISANFYVTEREFKKHELFYYPKPVWKKLVQQTITSLKEEKFRLLDEESAIGFFRNRGLGFSKVRFLPKETCLRLLANLGKPSVVQFPKHDFDSRCCFRSFKEKTEIHGEHSSPCGRRPVKYFSVNSVLKELDTILRRVKVEKPELLGSSVFGYNDVYQKIHQFLSKVKIRQSEKPNIYIVVADVLKAFDSIDQDKLIGILDDILENDMYGISRHAMISCKKGYFGTTYDHCLPSGCNNSNFASIFGPSFQSLPTNSILIDQYKVVWKKKRHLLLLLKEHLKHNILQIGQDFFLQKVGIPQGSILSTLLCCYYYGDMEKKMILPHIERNSKDLLVNRSSYASNYCTTEMETDNVKYLWQPKITVIGKNNDHHAKEANAVTLDMDNSIVEESLLLRFIDDFLFISTSKEQASRFFNRIGRGFSSYNCFMNKKKFGMNFDVAQKSCLVNRVYTGGDGVSFLPWSGLLINCQTLEIQADYTRYFGIHIRDTVTIKLHAKPLYHLKRQMFLFVRMRCHPIFYDSNINSLTVVSLNAYQAILLSAMKFHCYVHSMKDVTELDPMYLLEIIERSFRYMYKHIKKLMHDILYCFGIRPSLVLQKKEMLWLGLYAYARVLKKKHSQHKKLLSLLMSKISQHVSIEDAPLHLKYALDEPHSSCFLKLKF
ncbi:telomerase reverse transcriptase isoform X5 [Canna indica]|uniref:Telomerase reverse transcriptase n=1 Tax=Canna indica TaxID=4628 RepID=A0AAQ3Q4K3_9LILI|nr:telomerase reverse transcriptase isoform X5 [Canna indica]